MTPFPTAWTFAGAVGSSEPFAIDGLDVWQHPWQSVAGAPPAAVRDPHYNQPYQMPVYRIGDGTRSVVFASGEFSNGIFGFYVPAAPTSSAARPPAMPIVTHRISAPDRPLFAKVAPYTPLIASIFELPWIVLMVMMAMGTRENAGPPNPYWERQLSLFLILPVSVGLLAGLVVLVRGDAQTAVSRGALAIGCVACAGFIYWFGRGMFAPI